MVNLTRIYTRTGDDGTTSLGDMSRTTKTDLRLEAYADVDEANSSIGVAVASGGLDADIVELLTGVQNDLFDVGADLCVPPPPEDDEKHRSRLRVSPDQVAWLEQCIDEINEQLPALTSFVVPGGTPLSAHLHVARTICRRAERDVVELAAQEPVTREVITYLNRLSDLLFVLARAGNGDGGEKTWRPGASRA